MQTIARANRVYSDKECGLIINYLDVFKYLKCALAELVFDHIVDQAMTGYNWVA